MRPDTERGDGVPVLLQRVQDLLVNVVGRGDPEILKAPRARRAQRRRGGAHRLARAQGQVAQVAAVQAHAQRLVAAAPQRDRDRQEVGHAGLQHVVRVHQRQEPRRERQRVRRKRR